MKTIEELVNIDIDKTCYSFRNNLLGKTIKHHSVIATNIFNPVKRTSIFDAIDIDIYEKTIHENNCTINL